MAVFSQPPNPPSIGSVFGSPEEVPNGALFDETNARLKGTFTIPVLSDRDLNDRLQEVSQTTWSDLRADRITVKFLVGPGVDYRLHGEKVAWRRNAAIEFEGFVPVNGHPTVAGIAYYGAVDPRRMPPVDTEISERNLHRQALANPSWRDTSHVRCEVLTPIGNQDVCGLVDLYNQRFDRYLVRFTHETVRFMVGGSLTMVIRETGKIVSVAIAERVVFAVPGAASISFYEISDVATDTACGGRGYALALYRALIGRIRREEPNAVVTTEIRACWAPLYRIMVASGFVEGGYLPAHCLIRSVGAETIHQAGDFGDLALFFHNPNPVT
ncbi:MAG: hypothetical protein A3G08_00565 [Candidatus Magasanikbacteria bacterium RIFCSPLOWO2_12_FULL_47_9b]|nr:MAG: hypothetical protein A3I74_03525 [Candidatus Magasanikbacteria bacterium RIFCSPLOWO2_02_FULL_47_16]OGH80269.1 MAG: hypothetical protein A3C10_03805 [Candidatus Magasanikbacteria bacterium RIFCSPHIGHO2_02_FULL_48_18]OGH81982.1 MAG: hypothetical protein A3G08_00565 [Candidatus Magasanikbacteria bacterium RIFCSPLOWO2_12_FULL_47_9b]